LLVLELRLGKRAHELDVLRVPSEQHRNTVDVTGAPLQDTTAKRTNRIAEG
jgi:hypothetical protein